MQEAQAILSQVISFKDNFKPNVVLAELTENSALQTALCERWSLKYKTIVHNLRTEVQNGFPEIDAKNIDEVQLRLTQGYALLLKSMLEEAFRLMGEPPCAFAWVGAGSFSRSEVLPYSDAEYLWLFEEESVEVRRYFWAVDRLIVAQIHSIDEPLGLHPDQYPEVTPDEKMGIALPDSMGDIINRFNTKCRTPEGVYTEILSNLQGCLIEGDETLWLNYLRRVNTQNPLHDIFHKLLLVSVGDYDKTWGEGSKSRQSQLDIKQGYGYFLTYLAIMLKFYHGVEGNSTQEIWKALIAAQKIAPALGKDMAIASQEIQALRCRMHFFYQESRQDIDSSQSEDGKIYPLSEEEQQTLLDIQKLIQQVYRHLGAVKKIESLTKLKKAQTEESFKESLKALADLLGEYHSLEMGLMKPRLSQEIVASYFYRLLTLPQYLGTSSGEMCLLFLLKSGVSADKPNTLGIKPMEVILSWSEEYPNVAQKIWQILLNFGGNSEEILSNGKDNLLAHAIHLQKHETFIALCHVGTGRTNAPAVVFHYIYTQLSSLQTSSLQKQSLQNALPRLMQQNPTVGWQLALSSLRLEQDISLLQLEGTYTPQGFLNPEMEKELFKRKGKIQAVNEYGRREVAKCTLNSVINVYAKFYPELPGMEESVRSLSCMISSHQTVPNSELFCFKNKTKEYPVLISQEVIGENLQTVLNQAYRDKKSEALEKLNALDKAQWTALFILTVLIHPEDGKPDNYILKPFQNDQGQMVYAIIGIDNDHAFVEAFTNHADENKAFQIKTIVYCLNHMQVPLDLTVVQDFLAKDPEKILSDWLDSLACCQKRYEQLFSQETRERLFKKESVPQIVFPLKSLPKLYERWIRLKKALTENPSMTAMTALLYTDPQVGLRYQMVFEAHTQPLERFHAIASPAYLFSPKVGKYKTLVTSSQLLESQNVAPKFLLSSQQYGPEEAKKELYQALSQHKNIENLVRQLSQGDIDSFANIALTQTQEAVLKKFDFSTVDTKQQEKFIRLILDKKTGLFGLESLVLINLTPLTATDLLKLLQASPALNSLRLVELPNIKKLNFLKFLPLQNQIKTVILQKLTHCTKINLHLPALKHLILVDLPICQEINLPASQQLKRLKVQDCPALNYQDRYNLICQNNVLTLEDCGLDEWMRKDAEKASAFLMQRLENTQLALSLSEMWLISEGFKTLKTKKLALTMPSLSQEKALFCFSTLLHNTVIEHIEINTQKSKVITAFTTALVDKDPHTKQSAAAALGNLKQVTLEVITALITAGKDKDFSVRYAAALALVKLQQVAPKDIPVLMTMLKDNDPYVRQFAASVLGNLKQAIPEVTATLLQVLKDEKATAAFGDKDYRVRHAAAEVLGNLKQVTPAVITTLLTALEDENLYVRQSAAEALGSLKQPTRMAINMLIRTLEDKNNSHSVRQLVAEVLGNLKQVTPAVISALIEALGNCYLEVRHSAAVALMQLGHETSEIIKELMNALLNKESWVKHAAAVVLIQLGHETPEVITALIMALENDEPWIQQSAAVALGKLGYETPDVILMLIKALGSYYADIRHAAAATLMQLGHETPEVTAALTKALKNDYYLEIMCEVAEVLVQLGHETPKVIKRLIKALKKENECVRQSAALTLGSLKQVRPEVTGALIMTLGNKNYNVRHAAVEALVKLGHQTPEIITLLITAFGDKNPCIRQSAAAALVELGHETSEIIATLITALEDEDCWVRRSAAEALGNLKRVIPEGITALIMAFEDKDSCVRHAAVEAVENLKQVTPDAITALLKMVGEKDYDVRHTVAAALGKLGHERPDIITMLIKVLEDENCWARQSAAMALGNLKQVTPEIIDALIIAFGDKAPYVKYAVAEALIKLGNEAAEIITVSLKTLWHSHLNVRQSAAEALVKLGYETSEVIDVLIVALEDKDPYVRQSAAEVLGNLKQVTPEVIDALIMVLGDKDPYVYQSAAEALGNLKQVTPEVIDALIITAGNKDLYASQSAAEALIKLDHETVEITATLIKTLLRNKYSNIRQSAAEALGNVKHVTPKVTDALIKALEDKNHNVRHAAVEALVKLGREIPEIIIALITALGGENCWVKQSAAEAVGNLKQATPEVIAALLKLLRDEEVIIALGNKDYKVRHTTAGAFGNLKEVTPELIMALIEALKDDVWEVRQSAAEALGKLEQVTPKLITGLIGTLKDDVWEVRQSVAEALGNLKQTTPEVISALITALEDNEFEVRNVAATALGNLKQVTPEVVTVLIKALGDYCLDVSHSAAAALIQLGREAPEIITPLIKVLQNKELWARHAAAVVLIQLGHEMPEIITVLIKALQNEEPWVRHTAAVALGKLGHETPEIIAALITALGNYYSDVSYSAAAALIQLGYKSPEVITTLIKALQNKESLVRQAVAVVLIQLRHETPEVITALVRALRNKEFWVRQAAAEALGKLKEVTPSVVTALIKTLRSEESWVRQAATEVLVQLENETPEVITALITALGDKDYNVQQSAAEVLVKLGQETPEVTAALLKALEDGKKHVRRCMAEALGNLKQVTPEVITALVTALEDKDYNVQQSATEALVKLGYETPEVITWLLKALEDGKKYVRRCAAEALGNLKQVTPEVITVLITALEDEESVVRQSAATALVKLGYETPEISRISVEMSWDSHLSVIQSAAAALVKLGHETPEVINALLMAFEGKAPSVRQSAAEALENLKQVTPEVIAALIKRLGDKDKDVGQSSAKALIRLGRETPDVIRELIKVLKGKDKYVKPLAAAALIQLGYGTREVITALIEALEDKEDVVRQFAAEALGELFKACPNLNKIDLQVVRDLSGKFNLLMQETECTLIFYEVANVRVLQALLIDMLIPVSVEGLQIKIPNGIAIVGLTDLLWSLQPAKVVCELDLAEIHLTALSRFQPRIEILVLKNKDMGLLKLALMHTQGVLERVEYGEQHLDFFPLKRLRKHLEINRKNAKTLQITLQNMSSMKVAHKLLDNLCVFIEKIDSMIESHLSEKMLEIRSEQEIVIADIFNVLKALQAWAGLQRNKPMKQKKQKVSRKPKEVKKLHTAQNIEPIKLPSVERDSGSSESHAELNTPVNSPLTRLITPIDYSEIFRRYREPIWTYIEGKTTVSLQTLVENVVHAAVQPIEKIILLEAIEWQKTKFSQYDEQMQDCQNELTLAQSFQAQGKKPHWEAIPALLKTYQAYLKNYLYDASAQQAYNSCLVLVTALQAKQMQEMQGKKWHEKVFFKQLTEQQVYQTCQMPLSQPNLEVFRSSSIKSLWKDVLKDSQQRLPVTAMEAQKHDLGTQIKLVQQRYQDFIACLQQYLALPLKQWKYRYFNQALTHELQRCGGKNGNFIYGFFHLNRDWDNKRWVCFDQAQFSSLLGSTYFSNDKPLEAEETLCLDANYQQDHTGATADGYGHFGSLAENRKVQLAAYRAVKYMTRYAALYPDPESLMAELPALFQHVGKAVKFSFLHPEEAGTASCVLTRVFHTEKGITLVCAGIGDGMVAVFDPVKKIAKTLIAPRQYDRGGQFTPLSITEKLAEESLQTVCCELSDKAVIFRMTDGAWEVLPHQVTKYHDPQTQRDYLAYTLKEDFLFQFCAALDIEEATTQEYRQRFETYIQENIESRRQKLIEQQQLIQKHLSAFEEVHTNPHALMGDFMTWAENQQPDFSNLLQNFLQNLNIDIIDIQKLPLTRLHVQLEHISLGDDITLHVEGVADRAQVATAEERKSLV